MAVGGIASLAVLAACNSPRGLEIDVTHAPESATSAAVIVVANDTCTINGMPCSDWGTGISLDGNAPTAGRIDEITGYKATALVNGSATFVIPLADPPDNFWRIAVVAMADQQALAALVFQQVHVTSQRAQLTASFAAPTDSYPVDLAFDPLTDDISVDEPVPFPCFAVDVDGSGQGREYYVPSNNHDCDHWAVTDTNECDDLWANYPGGLPAAPAIEQCVGTIVGGTCATASCKDGTGRLCTPILGSGNTPPTYPPGTQCLPPSVCSDCSGPKAYDPTCPATSLNNLIVSAAGDTGGIINCTLFVDGSNNVCSSSQALPYSFPLLPVACPSVSIGTLPLEIPVAPTTMAIAGVTSMDGDWRVPYDVSTGSSTTSGCTITFGSSIATQSSTGDSDFAFDVTLDNRTRVVLPVHIDVKWLGSGTGSDCLSGQGSSMCESSIDLSGDYLSCGL
jgi:hypothetical protein